MVLVEIAGKKWHMSARLKEALDYYKEKMKKNFDCLIIIDGLERLGKTTLAAQILFYVTDGTFSVDDVVYTAEDYKKRVAHYGQSGEKYQGILFDEAFRGLSSRRAMSLDNYEILQVLQQSGKYRLWHVFCLPSFYELDRYAAIWRSEFLIHVSYDHARDKRGRLAIYGREAKKGLYLEGKKSYSYLVRYPNVTGYFSSFFPIDEEAYERQKDQKLLQISKERDKEEKAKEKKGTYVDDQGVTWNRLERGVWYPVPIENNIKQ